MLNPASGRWNIIFGHARMRRSRPIQRVLGLRCSLAVDIASIHRHPNQREMSLYYYKCFVFGTRVSRSNEWLRSRIVHGIETIPSLFALPLMTKRLQSVTSLYCCSVSCGAVVMGLTAIYIGKVIFGQIKPRTCAYILSLSN